MKKIKLILFDIDNTIVFGEDASRYYKQYSSLLEEALAVGLKVTKEEAKAIADEHRRNFNGRGERAFETHKINTDLWHKMICANLDPNQYIKPLHTSNKILTTIRKKYDLGAITDGPTYQARRILKTAQINEGLFKIFIGWEIGNSLPKGGRTDVFEEIIRKTHIHPEEILMVGDSLETDIIPANACGMNTLYISENTNNKFQTIKSIEQLENYLEQNENKN